MEVQQKTLVVQCLTLLFLMLYFLSRSERFDSMTTKLVTEIPIGGGLVRQVWEGQTVAESFTVIGLPCNPVQKAIYERNMEISKLLTREARIEAREKNLKEKVDKLQKCLNSLSSKLGA